MNEAPPGFRSSRWLMAATAVATALSGWALWKHAANDGPRGGLTPGRTAPAIRADAWLNVSDPAELDFQGRLLLVQGWFTTCPKCHAETPELVELYERFHPRGVEFVSLTFEDVGQLEAIRQFVHDKGIIWPVGYGARTTLRAFEAAEYPCLWLIEPGGRIVWNHDSAIPLAKALESALESALGNAGA